MHTVNKYVGAHAIIALLLSPVIGFALAFWVLHLHLIIAIVSGLVASWVFAFLMLLQFQSEMRRDIRLKQ